MVPRGGIERNTDRKPANKLRLADTCHPNTATFWRATIIGFCSEFHTVIA